MGEIFIAGLGPGAVEHLPPAVFELMKRGGYRVFLRTRVHPVVGWLEEQGVVFESFDRFYEEAGDFGEVYRNIADAVVAEAALGPVVYAVPGHPLVAEEPSRLIMKTASEKGLPVTVLPAMSFLDALLASLQVDPAGGLYLLDGMRIYEQGLDPGTACVVMQVYDRMVAADVKLALMEHYPPEHRVCVVRAAGVPAEERIEVVPLYELDRLDWLDHLTSVYVPPLEEGVAGAGKSSRSCRYPLDPLVEIMERLRGEDGCPWDREQTHRTLVPYLVEETYEVLEAIEMGDRNKLCEELGDLLLQIVFHVQIAREDGGFDANEVIDGICRKLVRRHPHVFGSAKVRSSAEVMTNWQQIKRAEKSDRQRSSFLEGVGRGMPALPRAVRLQQKAAEVGFDWPDYRGALEKIGEEVAELKLALERKDRRGIEQEMGDILFAAANVARLLGVDAEMALIGAVRRFERRFEIMERRAAEAGRVLSECSLDELEEFWNEAKKIEKQKINEPNL